MSEILQTTLGALIEFQRGFDLPKSEFKAGTVPVISSNGILGYHNEFKAKAPGVTIGRSGTVGLPHFIEVDFFPHNTALFVKDFKGNSPRYIYYLIQTLGLNEYRSGSGVPTMNRNHLHPIQIRAYLDIDIQEKIASILSSLDSKIELNNKINVELEAVVKTIYDYWFVQFDFPISKEQAKAMGKPKLEGKPYKSSGGKMVWNEALKREIPEGWGHIFLDKISDIVGGSTPSKENDSYFSKDGIPWITPKDLSMNVGNKFIKHGELDVTIEGKSSASLNLLPKGTVLMSSRAPIGYLAITSNDVTTNQGFKSFVPKDYFSTEYIYYVVKNLLPVIEANASGSTFKEISGSVLKSIRTLGPQKEFVDLFTLKVNPIFKMQELLEKENQELASLRDWLLPMLMNGQVKVKDGEEMVKQKLQKVK